MSEKEEGRVERKEGAQERLYKIVPQSKKYKAI